MVDLEKHVRRWSIVLQLHFLYPGFCATEVKGGSGSALMTELWTAAWTHLSAGNGQGRTAPVHQLLKYQPRRILFSGSSRALVRYRSSVASLFCDRNMEGCSLQFPWSSVVTNVILSSFLCDNQTYRKEGMVYVACILITTRLPEGSFRSRTQPVFVSFQTEKPCLFI